MSILRHFLSGTFSPSHARRTLNTLDFADVLDATEFVERTEQKFGISIPDDAVEPIRTMGAYHDLVVGLVAAKTEALPKDQGPETVWARLCGMAAEFVDAGSIDRSTTFFAHHPETRARHG